MEAIDYLADRVRVFQLRDRHGRTSYASRLFSDAAELWGWMMGERGVFRVELSDGREQTVELY